ncbi:SCO family protein [bacterium]|nr:SCO family protein [bacterium]
MRLFFAACLLALIACEKKISSEYDKELSAIAEPKEGLPYLVGKDLRPTWILTEQDKARVVENFDFKDQENQQVALKTLKSKVTVVSFFYSRCPGICPLTTKNLSTFQKKFLNENRVKMISFSITPEHDNPTVLKNYAKMNHIDRQRWHLLTGSREKIYHLARESFSADTFSPKENERLPLNEKDFLHSENVYLIDEQHRLRGVYAGMLTSSIEDLIKDAELLLKQ